MLDLHPGPTSFARTLGSRLPSSKLRYSTCICFCREFFPLAVSFCLCREVFAFAVRYFVFAVRSLVLPWGILFLPWGLWFCREVFCFCHEVFCFCREGSGFAVTVNTTVHVLYTIGGHRFILIPQPIKCPLQLDFPLNERSNDKVRASGVLKQFRFKKYTTLIPFCKVLFSKQLHLVNQTVQLHSIC